MCGANASRLIGDFRGYGKGLQVFSVQQHERVLVNQRAISAFVRVNKNFGKSESRCDDLNIATSHRLKERVNNSEVSRMLFNEVNKRRCIQSDGCTV